MKVYTLEEKDYSDLEESLECIIKKAEKFLRKMESGSFENRMGWKYREDDEYDWKIKKGYPERY